MTITEQSPHAGPICPCGHPVAGHCLAGCIDEQWFENYDDWCLCQRTEDEAEAAAASQGAMSD